MLTARRQATMILQRALGTGIQLRAGSTLFEVAPCRILRLSHSRTPFLRSFLPAAQVQALSPTENHLKGEPQIGRTELKKKSEVAGPGKLEPSFWSSQKSAALMQTQVVGLLLQGHPWKGPRTSIGR